MDKKQLMNNLAQLGFPLFELEEGLDVNHTLAEVVRSRDPRLWEGFPVLFKNALDYPGFDEQKVSGELKGPELNLYVDLVSLSLAVFSFFSVSVDYKEKDSAKTFMRKRKWDLRNEASFDLDSVHLSLDRVKRLFQDYYLSAQAEEEKRRRVAQEEVTLEYALSQVFSPKQKELFRKKLDGKPLTKTEREYYSRVVKKKVMALANEELHRLARLVKES